MKALMVTPSYPRYPGDYHGSFIQSLCQRLSPYVELSVLAPRSRTMNLFSEKFELVRFPYMPLQRMECIAEQTMKNAPSHIIAPLPFYLLSAYLNILKSSHDLIHLHIMIPLGLPVIYSLKGKPIIITCHGSDLTYPSEKRYLKPVCKKILKKASRVVTVSKYLKKFADFYGVNSTVIPVGVDVNRFSPRRKTSSRIIIGVLGRLVPEKRVQDTLKAVKILEKKLDIELHIAGDGPELSKLEKFSQKNKISTVFHGRIREPEHFLRNCNIFVLSSIREGLSLSLQEAMSCGCVPVAVNNFGCDELITHEENGYLFNPGNIKEMTECIMKAANNQIIGEKARETIVKHYNVDKNVLKYLDEYRVVLE